MNVRFEDDFFCGLPVGSSRTQDERVCAQSAEGAATGACLSQSPGEEGEAAVRCRAGEAAEALCGAEDAEHALSEISQTATSCRVTRSRKVKAPLKWYGGKFYLAPWIVDHFPADEKYTHYLEPYAGGLSVLFALPPGKSEAVNDLNSGLSDFWFVLANTPTRMIQALWGTPLSQQVWQEANIQAFADVDRVKRATAFFIRYRQSRQGLGKDYCTPTKRVRRGMNENVSSWLSAVDGLQEAHERMRRVEVRNMDALEFIRKYDHEKALFYLDPPYVHATRKTKQGYDFEMSDEDHSRLLDVLSGIEGMFILSGYPSELYDGYAARNGWRRVECAIDNKASSKKKKEQKTEVLWLNFQPT